jgi:hypothetical protein
MVKNENSLEFPYLRSILRNHESYLIKENYLSASICFPIEKNWMK